MKRLITKSIKDHIKTTESLLKQTSQITQGGKAIIDCLESGGKIMICGNGGSAADSQHMAAELIGRFKQSQRRPLAALALTTDTSVITAVANDFGIESVFSKQIAALGRKEDILILISTSGNSENLLQAVNTAKQLKIKTLGLLGKAGGRLNNIIDMAIIVESHDTARIQESHSLIIHAICEIIESHFRNKEED
jgi:D-sedoheptulose 7-phosphate isomerase